MKSYLYKQTRNYLNSLYSYKLFNISKSKNCLAQSKQTEFNQKKTTNTKSSKNLHKLHRISSSFRLCLILFGYDRHKFFKHK